MQNTSFTKQLIVKSLPLLAVATIACLFTSVAVQQNYRMSANDPQTQIAEDSGAFLSAGGKPGDLFSQAPQVDISKSLAPFVALYDDTGKFVGATGFLNAKPVEIPSGVIEAARKIGRNEVTWEPQKGVRSALVIVHFKGSASGFMVVGRSLREIEIREDNLTKMTLAAWGASVLAVLVLVAFSIPRKKEVPTV